MRIISLCSSSKANCTYIENGSDAFIVDIGCSYKALCDGLTLAGKRAENVKAVFITHEHSDHIGGLLMFTKKHNVPIFASQGTLEEIALKNKADANADLRLISELSDAPLDIAVSAFHTPHDSAESVGYTFDNGEFKAAVCTDLGRVTAEVRENLLGSRFVLLEANYEPDMLARNPHYSFPLKERIRSNFGHLSNIDSAAFACELVRSGTVSLLLGHLSQENNTPETASSRVLSALASSGAQIGRDYILNVAAVRGSGKGIAV